MNDEMSEDDGSWIQWRRLILSEIQRLSSGQDNTNKTISLLEKDIVRLNIWAAICGAVGGIATTLILQMAIG